MGMFDTFIGSFSCECCGNICEVLEQTKAYGQYLNSFYRGDYIDVPSRNYYYRFETECPKCKTLNKLAIAIRNGQYVDVVSQKIADNVSIYAFDNIEDRKQRNENYKSCCDAMLGEEINVHNVVFAGKKRGDIIRVLNADWTIDDIYFKRIEESQKRRIFLPSTSFIISVHSGSHERIIEITFNNFLHKYRINVENKYDPKASLNLVNEIGDSFVIETRDEITNELSGDCPIEYAYHEGDKVWFEDPAFGDMPCVITSVYEDNYGLVYDIAFGDYIARNIMGNSLKKRQ